MKVAVPCFVALSFFLAESSFITKAKTITGSKISRLLIPGFFWGGVYYIASLGTHTGATIKDLFYQLILGGDHLFGSGVTNHRVSGDNNQK